MAKKKSPVKESSQIIQSPPDIQIHLVDEAPQETRKGMIVDEIEKLQEKYRGEFLGTPVLDDVQVPGCAPVESGPEVRKLPDWMNANNRTNEFLILILESLYRIEAKLNGR